MPNMVFAKKESKKIEEKDKWKILISDDEEDIHSLTKMVLRDFEYKDKGLEFLSAYSAKETIEILVKNDDIALILQDVIMESDDAGLEVIKKVREEFKNNDVQIVLRTGQAGQAPEEEVVKEYLINDYKEKTELTSKKLVTTVLTSIRSYENMKNINKLNHKLEGLLSTYDEYVIAARTDINGNIVYVTNAFCEISGYEKDELIGKTHRVLRHEDTTSDLYKDLWGTIKSGGVWEGEIKDVSKDGRSYWLHTIIQPEYDENGDFLYYTAISENITDKKEVEELNNQIIDTQKEIVFKLGAVAEARSKETGMHVKRVAEYSKLLALYYGLDEREAEVIKMASPMHDIGKVAIPDNILNKPGKFTQEEFEIMKTHAELGYEMLKFSNKEILKAAAIIAYHHQEKFDGNGYPQALKGEDIHIYGRITAVADVFDALGSDRVYKKAWEDDRIFELFRNERGKHFDPRLVDIFFEHLDEFLEIRDKFKDDYSE